MSINKPRVNRKEKARHRPPQSRKPIEDVNKALPEAFDSKANEDGTTTYYVKSVLGTFEKVVYSLFALLAAIACALLISFGLAIVSDAVNADELDLNTPTKVEAVQLEEVDPPVIAATTATVVPERIVLDMAVLADDDGTVFGKLSTGLVAIELFFTKTSVTEANKIVREIANCLEDGQSKYMVSARKCAEPYVDIPMNIYKFGIIDRVRNFW